jgi:hypothetical protein
MWQEKTRRKHIWLRKMPLRRWRTEEWSPRLALDTLSEKQTKSKRTVVVTQAVEPLPSKLQVLSSISSIT